MVRTAHTMIALVVNEGHALHHVHDRGYVESPARCPRYAQSFLDLSLWSPVATFRLAIPPIIG